MNMLFKLNEEPSVVTQNKIHTSLVAPVAALRLLLRPRDNMKKNSIEGDIGNFQKQRVFFNFVGFVPEMIDVDVNVAR